MRHASLRLPAKHDEDETIHNSNVSPSAVSRASLHVLIPACAKLLTFDMAAEGLAPGWDSMTQTTLIALTRGTQ